jgi:hypothetical protein
MESPESSFVTMRSREDSREGSRIRTPALGLLRNLTQNTHTRIGILRNLAKGAFLVESWQEANVGDELEFRTNGLTVTGEVIYCEQQGTHWLIGAKDQHWLDDDSELLMLDAL